ncbi:MAG: YraN family protein [Planctomycetota bacterium]|nr:YraN family protein [Planctomycetota bacterium]
MWIGKFCRRTRQAQPPLGAQGEALAARYLQRQGYRIIERGVRSGRGEIDLVARHGRTIVFVEVKTRRSPRSGNPALAVDEEKQRRLARLALAYCKQHRLQDCPARFDVVGIVWSAACRSPRIAHYVGAFEER